MGLVHQDLGGLWQDLEGANHIPVILRKQSAGRVVKTQGLPASKGPASSSKKSPASSTTFQNSATTWWPGAQTHLLRVGWGGCWGSRGMGTANIQATALSLILLFYHCHRMLSSLPATSQVCSTRNKPKRPLPCRTGRYSYLSLQSGTFSCYVLTPLG